jgi:hypothetical protein
LEVVTCCGAAYYRMLDLKQLEYEQTKYKGCSLCEEVGGICKQMSAFEKKLK